MASALAEIKTTQFLYPVAKSQKKQIEYVADKTARSAL
jgi:hypothetical protein